LSAALASFSGCDCGGAASVADGDDALDIDVSVDVEPDARDDSGRREDVRLEAEAWPDVPETCEWYELRSDFDDLCMDGGDSWVRDRFLAPGAEPILRMISIVQDARLATGQVSVRLRRTYRPVVLVLSAAVPEAWTIERDEGAQLERILLYGGEQSVVGADEVPLDDRGAATSLPFAGPCWPFCYSFDPRPVVADAETVTGLSLASFDGCNQSNGISLGDICREECRTSVACAGRECGYVGDCSLDCGGCPEGERCDGASCVPCTPSCAGRACGSDGCGGSCGDCDDGSSCTEDGACVSNETIPGCEDVTAESHYCITLAGDLLSEPQPAVLGLDSGTVCRFGKPDADLGQEVSDGTTSIAWHDGKLFACVDRTGARGLASYSALDDTMVVAPFLCNAVVGWGDGLIAATVEGSGDRYTLTHFGSFDDALDGVGDVWSWTVATPRMAVQGDRFYVDASRPVEIQVRALPGGETLRTVRPAGRTEWLSPMSVTSDGLLVLTGGDPPALGGLPVGIFDEATGVLLREVAPAERIVGLACFPGF
jgi:hypothetical protein